MSRRLNSRPSTPLILHHEVKVVQTSQLYIGTLELELVDIIQLQILHGQDPHPKLHFGDNRLRRTIFSAALNDVNIEEILV
jgi:hypothetical protein